MMQPLISVIVPCYNVEEYLPKCVESILNQTYRNLEILLVDDGSPDRSGEICDEYAVKDTRIKVIHKENGGLSDARNVALDVMKGEYVTFIDSDDYVALDYVESMCKQAQESGAEIVVTNWTIFYEGKEPTANHKFKIKKKIFTQEEALVTMFYQKDFDTAAWSKLYKSTLFEYQRFPKGLISEDLATVYLLMMNCEKISWNNYPCYYYMLRPTSIEGVGFNPPKYESYLKIINQFEQDKVHTSQKVSKAINCRIVSLLFHLLLGMPAEGEEGKIYIIKSLLHKYRWGVLTDLHARPKTKIAIIISYISIRLVRKISKFGSYR